MRVTLFGVRCAMCAVKRKVPRDVAKRVADGETFVCCTLCAAAYEPFWHTELVGHESMIIDMRRGRSDVGSSAAEDVEFD
jgi:hypothetical protein